jgi:hypothetical protein
MVLLADLAERFFAVQHSSGAEVTEATPLRWWRARSARRA